MGLTQSIMLENIRRSQFFVLADKKKKKITRKRYPISTGSFHYYFLFVYFFHISDHCTDLGFLLN